MRAYGWSCPRGVKVYEVNCGAGEGPGGRLDAAERERLVLEMREKAYHLARGLVRRWGVRVAAEDVRSASDLALCEAASRYLPRPDADFLTYLFYFIKGILARSLAGGKPSRRRGKAAHVRPQPHSIEHLSEWRDEIADETKRHCPECQAHLAEVRAQCRAALASLSPLESEVVVAVDLEDTKVAPLARRLGYSRGHLFSVRKSAQEKLRKRLVQLAGEV